MSKRWSEIGSRGRGGRRRTSVSALSCFQCDVPCRQLPKLEQGMASCCFSVRIISATSWAAKETTSTLVFGGHVLWQWLLSKLCATQFGTSELCFDQIRPGISHKFMTPGCGGATHLRKMQHHFLSAWAVWGCAPCARAKVHIGRTVQTHCQRSGNATLGCQTRERGNSDLLRGKGAGLDECLRL